MMNYSLVRMIFTKFVIITYLKHSEFDLILYNMNILINFYFFITFSIFNAIMMNKWSCSYDII